MDGIDQHLIRLLLANGRASYASLATAVGLSVAATKRRVDRLVRDRIISGFTATVEPQVLGWNVEAMVQLFTTGTVPLPEMRRDLEGIPEIREAFTVAGPADTVLRLVASDIVHLERVIGRLRGLPYVQQTDTTMLLSRILERPVTPSIAPVASG
jgi:DNA-binding Lrp family transcriptional regulator